MKTCRINVAGILMASLFLLLTAAPVPAIAAPAVGSLQRVEEGKTAHELWIQAMEEAERQGEPVISIPESYFSLDTISPLRRGRSYVSAKASCFLPVAAQPEVVYEIATFSTSGSDIEIIDQVYGCYITGFSGEITNSVVHYTKLDGGRTLAVNMTFTIKNYVKFSSTYETYAEFSPSGGGWMRATEI
ncbi:MAG: hypothetical protein LKJ82_05240 [Atopobiaceae bacterium]|jgi:hypothetical protein|nr:hypothetical protein [Atopobiaceae bacterium]